MPSAWLVWSRVASCDSASEGIALMFRHVFDLKSMAHEGIVYPSLYVSQLPIRVTNLMWGPFYVDGPGPIYYSNAYELMGKGVETGLLQVIPRASLCASQVCLMLRQLGDGMAGWTR